MIELLVCLGVLAIAMGSILSIFVVGTHFAATAQRRMDAGRVARAVFELADRGFTSGVAKHGRGAVDEGKFNVTPTSDEFFSQDMPAAGYQYAWAPTYVIQSPVKLVWKCVIYKPLAGTFDFEDMYNVVTTVSYDSDESDTFNLPEDKIIGTYYAVVADR